MILNTLQLRNYKQYAALSLDFREGLVGIIGKNGAGKSTLFEAILYCLFGRDEGNKSLVRSAFADPKSTVELRLDFTMGESLYRVQREFRGKALAVGAELYKNDVLVAKGVSAVNDELVRVLHIERDAFKRSVFSGQKELSELSDSTGEARKRMVRRMLGLDTLDDAQARINADIRDLNSQMAGQRQNLLADEIVQQFQSDLVAQDQTLQENRLTLESESQKLQAVESQYRAAKQQFDEEERRYVRFNALNRELGQLQERQTGLAAQHDNLKQKIADLQQQKAKLDDSRGEFATYETDKKQLRTLEIERQRHINRDAYTSKIQPLQDLSKQSRDKLVTFDASLIEQENVEQALREKQTLIEDFNQQRDLKLAEVEEIKSKISALQERVRERQAKIADLQVIGREGTCPTCFQPVLDAYDAVVAQLNQEVTTIQQTEKATLEQALTQVIEVGKGLRIQRDETEKSAQALRNELAGFRVLVKERHETSENLTKITTEITKIQLILREIGEVHFDEAGYQVLKDKLAAQEAQYLEFQKADNYVSRELPATLSALKNTEAGSVETAQKSTAKIAELAQTGYDAARYDAAKQSITGFDEVLSAQSAAVRILEKLCMELQGEMSKAQEKLRANERILAQVSDKLAEVDLLRKLAEMLGLFKTEVLEKVSPGISLEASELFSRITKGKYEGIQVDENFDFAIADGGIFYPIERFSGGEVDLANFCLRIAITKAIMELSGASADRQMEFLAFDEIFGSQDEERRLEMMLALNYLQEQFRQIYIVSHIESLKDFFPHLLEVQAGAEGSTVVWR